MGRMKERYIEEQWGQDMRNAPQAAGQNPERRSTADGFLDTLRAAITRYRAAETDADSDQLDLAAEVADAAAALDRILVAGASLPRAWQPNAPVGSEVHVLEYVHRHGNEITVHVSEDGVTREKAAIARLYWGEIKGADGVPDVAPDDDDEAARIYFDTQSERESAWAYSTVATIAD